MTKNQNTTRPTYSSYTYESPNTFKRMLHRNRYKNVLKNLGINPTSKILDFGCGDGRLFRVLLDQGVARPENLIGFDPVPEMQEQFAQLVPESKIYTESHDINTLGHDEEFDFIFCCEVLEHLTPAQTAATFSEFKRLGGTKTTFIIEVPIEIGIFGAFKNIYRRVISRANIPWVLIIKSLFGFGIIRRPRMTVSGHETFEHPGYSFKSTRDELKQFMHIDVEFNDPIRSVSFHFSNSHIFISRLK